MRRTAFRSPNWLGDAVMATVVPPAIRRSEPGGRLSVLVPAGLEEVFAGSPDVDEVVSIPRGREVDAYRAGGYDRVLLGPTSFGSAWRALRGRVRNRYGYATSGRGFLLRGSLPGSAYRRDRHQVENYRELAGLIGDPRPEDVPRVVVAESWRQEAARRWPASGGRRIALQPGATYGPAKRWAPERFGRVAAALAATGHSVAVVGGPGDAEPVRGVVAAAPGVRDLSGGASIGELAAVLESADLVITNDTGPMHLAAAVGTRALALFGSTSATWTRPWGEGHRVLDHPVPCAPCFRRTCRIGYPCLTGIEPERVEREARALLEEK